MSPPKEQADFSVIRERVTMEMVIDRYDNIVLKRKGDELRGPCPFCNKKSFSANTQKNAFQCFFCKAKGNVIDYVAKMEKCTLREAGLKIWAWFNLDQQTISPPAQDSSSGPSDQLPPTEVPGFNVQQEILITLKEILAELRLLRQEAR
jgi:DNA primase